jgi:hypothetical protein
MDFQIFSNFISCDDAAELKMKLFLKVSSK